MRADMRENEEREHPASDQVRGERWSTASFEVKGNTLEDGGREVESEGKVDCECFRRQVVFSSQQLKGVSVLPRDIHLDLSGRLASFP